MIKIMFKWKLLKLLYPLVKVVNQKQEHILCRTAEVSDTIRGLKDMVVVGPILNHLSKINT